MNKNLTNFFVWREYITARARANIREAIPLIPASENNKNKTTRILSSKLSPSRCIDLVTLAPPSYRVDYNILKIIKYQ